MGRPKTRKTTIGGFAENDITSIIQDVKQSTSEPTEPDSVTAESGMEQYSENGDVDTIEDIDVSDIQQNIDKKALNPEIVKDLMGDKPTDNPTSPLDTQTQYLEELKSEDPNQMQTQMMEERKNDTSIPQIDLSTAELLMKIQELKSVLAEKEKELSKISNTDIQGMLKKISNLQEERDELLLKNSELEFEISRLKASNTANIKVTHNIPTTAPNYIPNQIGQPIPSINNKQSVINYRRMINNITTPKNGYEEWN